MTLARSSQRTKYTSTHLIENMSFIELYTSKYSHLSSLQPQNTSISIMILIRLPCYRSSQSIAPHEPWMAVPRRHAILSRFEGHRPGSPHRQCRPQTSNRHQKIALCHLKTCIHKTTITPINAKNCSISKFEIQLPNSSKMSNGSSMTPEPWRRFPTSGCLDGSP